MYCWAVTIHKLQGLTLDKIVIDMDKNKGSFRAGQAYVGFSRVKKLEGLYILNYDRTQIKVDPNVESYVNLVKTNSLPPLPKSLTKCSSEGTFVLALQNAQNLCSHREDVLLDKSLIEADVLCKNRNTYEKYRFLASCREASFSKVQHITM